MKFYFLVLLLWGSLVMQLGAQDTFSIVAVDSATGEVGSAGASCVDLFTFGLPTDDFISQLIPGVGGINTQASYSASNQNNARTRMNAGDSPSQIIQWLQANDVAFNPQVRQYGIVGLINGSPQAAAFTGNSTLDYKNHIVGPNYAIQGNILLGQQVLDSMEARFLNTPGDLACKLMAALQGANVVGADTRCASNGSGTSSLFAFVKVAQPTDSYGNPSFRVSVRTANGAGIEPIDSLQTKFDQLKNCTVTNTQLIKDSESTFAIFPNPAHKTLTINTRKAGAYTIKMFNVLGEIVYEGLFSHQLELDVATWEKGMYVIQLEKEGGEQLVQKVLIE